MVWFGASVFFSHLCRRCFLPRVGVGGLTRTNPNQSLFDFLRHCRRFSFHERDFRSSLLRLRKSSLFVLSSLSVPNQIFSSFLPVGYQPLHYTLQGESSTASTATSAASWGSLNFLQRCLYVLTLEVLHALRVHAGLQREAFRFGCFPRDC